MPLKLNLKTSNLQKSDFGHENFFYVGTHADFDDENFHIFISKAGLVYRVRKMLHFLVVGATKDLLMVSICDLINLEQNFDLNRDQIGF